MSKTKLPTYLLRTLMTVGFLITGIPILMGLIFLISLWLNGRNQYIPKYQTINDSVLYTKMERSGKRVKVAFSHDSVHFGDNFVEFDYDATKDISFYYVAPDTIYVEEPAWMKCSVSGGGFAIIRIGYWPFTLYPRSSKLYSEYLGEKFLKRKYELYRDSVLLADKQYVKIPAYTLF